MKIILALKSGFAKVFESIRIIPIIYLFNISLALLLSVSLFYSLKSDTAKRTVRESLETGFDYEWWSEFNFQAEGIEKTFQPTIVGGFGPILENLELLLTGEFKHVGILIFLLGAMYVAVSSFFAGGAIAVYEDEKRKYSLGRFFSNSAIYFNRFFSLTFTAVILYFLVYWLLHPAIFSLVDRITANFMTERATLFVNIIGYFIVLVVILFINMLFDYAKVIVVVEKRDSAWEAVWLALKFLLKRFGKASGLYLLIGIIGLAIARVFALVLSVFEPNTVLLLIIAILIQQLYILVKITVRLVFYASQLDLFVQAKSLVRRLPKV